MSCWSSSLPLRRSKSSANCRLHSGRPPDTEAPNSGSLLCAVLSGNMLNSIRSNGDVCLPFLKTMIYLHQLNANSSELNCLINEITRTSTICGIRRNAACTKRTRCRFMASRRLGSEPPVNRAHFRTHWLTVWRCVMNHHTALW